MGEGSYYAQTLTITQEAWLDHVAMMAKQFGEKS